MNGEPGANGFLPCAVPELGFSIWIKVIRIRLKISKRVIKMSKKYLKENIDIFVFVLNVNS
jgi:hypothetical protein